MNTWTFSIIWVLGWIVVGGMLVVVAGAWAVRRKRSRLIADGLYPKPGNEKDEDVQRLLQAGHADMAVRCYQAVHRVSYREATEQLIGTTPTGYGYLPLGLVVGLSVGYFLRNPALGAGLGLMLGAGFASLMRKNHPRGGGRS